MAEGFSNGQRRYVVAPEKVLTPETRMPGA